MVFKELIYKFLLWEDVVVLKELIYKFLLWFDVLVFKKADF